MKNRVEMYQDLLTIFSPGESSVLVMRLGVVVTAQRRNVGCSFPKPKNCNFANKEFYQERLKRSLPRIQRVSTQVAILHYPPY